MQRVRIFHMRIAGADAGAEIDAERREVFAITRRRDRRRAELHGDAARGVVQLIRPRGMGVAGEHDGVALRRAHRCKHAVARARVAVPGICIERERKARELQLLLDARHQALQRIGERRRGSGKVRRIGWRHQDLIAQHLPSRAGAHGRVQLIRQPLLLRRAHELASRRTEQLIERRHIGRDEEACG